MPFHQVATQLHRRPPSWCLRCLDTRVADLLGSRTSAPTTNRLVSGRFLGIRDRDRSRGSSEVRTRSKSSCRVQRKRELRLAGGGGRRFRARIAGQRAGQNAADSHRWCARPLEVRGRSLRWSRRGRGATASQPGYLKQRPKDPPSATPLEARCRSAFWARSGAEETIGSLVSAHWTAIRDELCYPARSLSRNQTQTTRLPSS